MEMNSHALLESQRVVQEESFGLSDPPPPGGHQITLVLIEPWGGGCPSEMRNKVFDFP